MRWQVVAPAVAAGEFCVVWHSVGDSAVGPEGRGLEQVFRVVDGMGVVQVVGGR